MFLLQHRGRRDAGRSTKSLLLYARPSSRQSPWTWAPCLPGRHTTVKFFYFHSLEWPALTDESAWRCKPLFTLIVACALDAGAKGHPRVLIIVYYARLRSALEDFLTERASWGAI